MKNTNKSKLLVSATGLRGMSAISTGNVFYIYSIYCILYILYQYTVPVLIRIRKDLRFIAVPLWAQLREF